MLATSLSLPLFAVADVSPDPPSPELWAKVTLCVEPRLGEFVVTHNAANNLLGEPDLCGKFRIDLCY
ncbi:hypothetical protein [Paraburkholderia strydomiana]|uniref:hypothetical protein n=1 Tax=Paraburkholderia strydomiana TaxID=1245417 RepID=UPI002856B25E|nr:hypothetical protein [Paraburkholderia strydomiana]MDR7008862.1 hypothetical protein [Paraburkholderia strydomiana]